MRLEASPCASPDGSPVVTVQPRRRRLSTPCSQRYSYSSLWTADACGITLGTVEVVALEVARSRSSRAGSSRASSSRAREVEL